MSEARGLMPTATTAPSRIGSVLSNPRRNGIALATAGLMAAGFFGSGKGEDSNHESATSPLGLSAPDFLRPGPETAEAAKSDYPHVTLLEVINVVLSDASRDCNKRRKQWRQDEGRHYIAGDGTCHRPNFYGAGCYEQKPTPIQGYCKMTAYTIDYPVEPESGVATTVFQHCVSPKRAVIKWPFRQRTRDGNIKRVWRTVPDHKNSVDFLCWYDYDSKTPRTPPAPPGPT